ncbi:MAG: 50S ribosomal protein L28 [Patescibacteria group bacterium]
MAKTCAICGRGTTTAFNVSHSKVKTKRTQKINLQNKTVDGKKIRICTSCIKTQNKNKKQKTAK